MVTWKSGAIACACLIGGMAQGTQAASIAIDSAVFIEHQAADSSHRLEPATTLSRGDRVVTVLSWSRESRANSGGFTLTNPLPRMVAYQRSGEEREEVSADGGRTWGELGNLRYGSRLATPEDVTHVRWRVPAARAAIGRGRIAYSAIVR